MTIAHAHSESPTILLRVSDGTFHTHRSFNDFCPGDSQCRGLCRSGLQRRDDFGDRPVLDGLRAASPEGSCLELAT